MSKFGHHGQAYREKQAKSRSGLECKKWVQTTTTPDDNPTEGLEENFCRNPHGAQESIWCYVSGDQSELCNPLGGSSTPEESAEPDVSVVAVSMQQTAADQQENLFTEMLQQVEQIADALKTEAVALQADEQKLNPPNVEANVGFDETRETKQEEKQAKKKGNFDRRLKSSKATVPRTEASKLSPKLVESASRGNTRNARRSITWM